MAVITGVGPYAYRRKDGKNQRNLFCYFELGTNARIGAFVPIRYFQIFFEKSEKFCKKCLEEPKKMQNIAPETMIKQLNKYFL